MGHVPLPDCVPLGGPVGRSSQRSHHGEKLVAVLTCGGRGPKTRKGFNGPFLSNGIQGLASRGRTDAFQQLQDSKPGDAINRVLGPPQDGQHVLHMRRFDEFKATKLDEGDVPPR